MSNNLITWASIAAGSWIVLGALIAPRIGRALARMDAAMDDDPRDLADLLPPLDELDVDFINVIPADAELPALRTVGADDYDADLPAWLFDVPTLPLSQDEFDLSESILRGVA